MARDWRQILVLLVLALVISSYSSAQQDSEGCTAPLILPDLPFFVVWNHPSWGCERKNIHLNFEKWGIVDNVKDQFYGEKITLMYYVGKWPHYNNDGTVASFGGIPQLGNLTEHLVKSRNDVLEIIPQRNFTGLSVIDFEYWRPLYRLNWSSLRIYQKKSYALAKAKYPNMTHPELLAEATKEFEKSARLYVEETLKEVSAERPYGKWGYYGYPRCWDTYCNESTITTNDEMGWIFNHSTGFYPSIYFQLTVPPAERAEIIIKKMKETLRVKAKFARHDSVILPYALNQNGPFKFFSPFDLSYAIGLPADLGASGVVLWGSSSSMKPRNECTLLQDYINSTLGPHVQNVTQFFFSCSKDKCSGHGRCVRKDYEAFYQYHLKQNGRTDCSIQEETLKRQRKDENVSKKNDEKKRRNSKKRQPSEDNSLNFIYEKLKFIAKSRNSLNGFKTENDEDQVWNTNNMEENLEKGEFSESLKFKSKLSQGEENDEQSSLNFEIPQSNKENEVDIQKEEKDAMYKLTYDYDDYVCKCYRGWTGPSCDQTSNTNTNLN